ncbi:biogenesis of lysosome-related organelles complex 1 subunit 5 [Aethina tumida]|uniref:biogenesis of lysosome-related organelles complex 1 subunit 5 n=1 Tax=Aethina tumida TaxID=116153 RepID=UPI00096B2085|nr:biogenesis of lysosome-related organelles complex 1 subunit 5 [Aethina tumida]
MSNIVQDVSKIWSRLFDHKAFVGGEISFTLQEFEKKRGENEVDKLFTTIEVIADLRDSQVDRLKEAIDDTVPNTFNDIEEALYLCENFSKLEEQYKKDTTLADNHQKRKTELNKFMDDITNKYTEINSNFENKKQELKKIYEDLENQLKLQ